MVLTKDVAYIAQQLVCIEFEDMTKPEYKIARRLQTLGYLNQEDSHFIMTPEANKLFIILDSL